MWHLQYPGIQLVLAFCNAQPLVSKIGMIPPCVSIIIDTTYAMSVYEYIQYCNVKQIKLTTFRKFPTLAQSNGIPSPSVCHPIVLSLSTHKSKS